jgi:hypothetical protein
MMKLSKQKLTGNPKKKKRKKKERKFMIDIKIMALHHPSYVID